MRVIIILIICEIIAFCGTVSDRNTSWRNSSSTQESVEGGRSATTLGDHTAIALLLLDRETQAPGTCRSTLLAARLLFSPLPQHTRIRVQLLLTMTTEYKRFQMRDKHNFLSYVKVELKLLQKEWMVLLPCVIMQCKCWLRCEMAIRLGCCFFLTFCFVFDGTKMFTASSTTWRIGSKQTNCRSSSDTRSTTSAMRSCPRSRKDYKALALLPRVNQT